MVTTVDSITPGAPSDAAVLLQPSPEAAEVARVVHGLLDDSDRRAALGAAAGAFVEQERRRGPVAFAAALEACVLTARDPVGPAMDRWAGALADLGVDEEYLEAGYFLRYARALTSFAGTPQERPEPPGTSLLDSP